ncbi:hypothetical protein [Amycolatopsis pittospori]|uniref:hypothetical protein n=1 Tax=Amycolatopsis pittospori TaxID=2749434 RepID=UPI0015F0A757|nr:hypothetical protein [Amycolatopsis pittospori]
MSGLSEPYMVHDPWKMAGELMNGRWLVARWEHLGEHEDLRQWTAVLLATCEEVGVEPIVLNVARKSLTIVFNGSLPPPTFDQVETTIRAIDYHRFLEREIKPEVIVKRH